MLKLASVSMLPVAVLQAPAGMIAGTAIGESGAVALAVAEHSVQAKVYGLVEGGCLHVQS